MKRAALLLGIAVSGWIAALVSLYRRGDAYEHGYRVGFDDGECEGFEDGQRQAAGA